MKGNLSLGRLLDTLAAVMIAAVLVVSPGCSKQTTEKTHGAGEFIVARELAEFSENGVSVKVALETDTRKQALLRATLIPDKGFHLYSKDLPEGGIDGVGVPTRFLVIDPKTLAAGKPFANVEPQNLHVKSVGVFPVYPEGPVTIRIPIQITSGTQGADAKLSFTYMACNNRICLRPVYGKELTVRIPGPL